MENNKVDTFYLTHGGGKSQVPLPLVTSQWHTFSGQKIQVSLKQTQQKHFRIDS